MDNQQILEDIYQALLDEGLEPFEAHELAYKIFWSKCNE